MHMQASLRAAEHRRPVRAYRDRLHHDCSELAARLLMTAELCGGLNFALHRRGFKMGPILNPRRRKGKLAVHTGSNIYTGEPNG